MDVLGIRKTTELKLKLNLKCINLNQKVYISKLLGKYNGCVVLLWHIAKCMCESWI